MSPVSTYRQLIGLAGPMYVVTAFLARIPLAMSQLATLLLVAGSTGSYGAGGTSAGALAVANAVASPLTGSLSDRLGQRRVVLVQSLGGAAGLLVLVALAAADVPWGWQAVAAAVSGAVMPQVGPLARVRWRPLTRSAAGPHDAGRLVDTAFSYEGAADEASFVLGPAFVGISAALLFPSAALVAAAVILAVFGSLFALHPSADLVDRARAVATGQIGRLLTGALVLLACFQFVIGTVFGSVQTGTSVLATAAGVPGLTGLLHALLGVGSVIAGLAVAVLPRTFTYERRLALFAVLLLVLSLPLIWVDTLTTLAPTLLVLGIAVAPYMITVFTLAERITPPQRTGAAMTVLAGATGLGYAAGSTIAGRLADWGGHTPAFVVTISAGGLASVLAIVGARRLRADQVRGAGQPAPHARTTNNA